jgi:hypothetical protein
MDGLGEGELNAVCDGLLETMTLEHDHTLS